MSAISGRTRVLEWLPLFVLLAALALVIFVLPRFGIHS